MFCHTALGITEHVLEIQDDKECGDAVEGDVDKVLLNLEQQVPGDYHAVAGAGENLEDGIPGEAGWGATHLGLCKLVFNCTFCS